MISLFGVYRCTVDVKGRVMMPSNFKKVISKKSKDGFMIKQSIFSKCLELFPTENWNEHTQNVLQLGKFRQENIELMRLFSAGINPVDTDSNFRVLIPKELMLFAGLKKDIVMAGLGTFIELWDKKAYDKFILENANRFTGLTEKLLGGKTE
jgi:MraZ protein